MEARKMRTIPHIGPPKARKVQQELAEVYAA